MSDRMVQVRRAAHDTLLQDARLSEANRGVINLRPLRGERTPYDSERELRQLPPLDVWQWTLILIGLHSLSAHTAHELADQIEERLKHPSAQVSL